MEKFLDNLNKKQINYLCKYYHVNEDGEYDNKDAFIEFIEINNNESINDNITSEDLIDLLYKKKDLDLCLKSIKSSLDNKLFLEINEQLLNTFNQFKNGLINFNEYKNKINITITSSHLINKIVLKNIKINLKDEVLNLDDLKLFVKKIPKDNN